MPKQVRLAPTQVKGEVRDLSRGESGFVLKSNVFTTRPDLKLWVSGMATVYDEGLGDCIRIKRLARGVRVFAPKGMQFHLFDNHGKEDIPVIRITYKDIEDEEQAGEP